MKRYGSENAEEYKPSLGEVEETFDEWYERRGYVHSYACNKIFTRRLWGDARFPEGRYFEDLFTIPYVLRRAEKIVAIASGLYYKYAFRRQPMRQRIKCLLRLVLGEKIFFRMFVKR